MSSMKGYREDLAYVHDAGFRDYCLNAAPGLLRALKRNGITGGLVVDLGCGSGRWARELNRAGYEVLGVEQSPAFIRLARKIAPQSRFMNASLLRVALPACDAVTSIGECLNYTFDRKARKAELARLFGRVNRALRPGGVFIFDVAEPGRIPENGPRREWFHGADWAILVEADGDRKQSTLTRKIICFRKRGRQYRRSEETHPLHLFPGADIVEMLGRAGFEAERLTAYGRFQLPVGIAAFLARKRTRLGRSRSERVP
jgi:SAM-dependent methyltransferase